MLCRREVMWSRNYIFPIFRACLRFCFSLEHLQTLQFISLSPNRVNYFYFRIYMSLFSYLKILSPRQKFLGTAWAISVT